MKISISTYHDCRSRTINPETDPCPVKLYINSGGTRKYSPLILPDGRQLKLTKKQHAQVMTERPRGEAKRIRAFIDAEITRARKIVSEMQRFDMGRFERNFTGNMAGLSLSADMREYAGKQKGSTKSVYLYAIKSLADFLGKDEVLYQDLTRRKAAEFVEHLRKTRSGDTEKTYIGAIKAVINRTKDFDELPENYNPFKGYKAPQSKKKQLSLSKNQFDALVNYSSPKKSKQFARDVFVFCTLMNGQYPNTVLRLKKSDIRGNWIHYVRQKTKDKTGTKLQAYISDTMKEIISRYDSEYLFEYSGTVKEARRAVTDSLKAISKEINETQPLLNLPRLTVKYCRGTYLRLAVEQGGMSYEQASRTAGHTNTSMSDHYYSGRNLKDIEEAARKIG